MEMKCWKVTCRETNGTEYDVGVMCSDEDDAKKHAELSLREGRHIAAKAMKVVETDGI